MTSSSGGQKSRSVDNFGSAGVWSNSPTLVALQKSPERGLGFSVLDFQDPLAADETVIIVKSLVPGGTAHRDGRLLPGDRLLFVNDTSLVGATLEEAVQCLKAAPAGPVRLGVAKPCPLAPAYLPSTDSKEVSVDASTTDDASTTVDDTAEQEDEEEEEEEEEEELPPIPEALERTLKLRKSGYDELGIVVESVASGVNGCVVRELLPTGAAHLDGTLKPGDFVTAVNSESLRRLPTQAARGKLRRADLVNHDVLIHYIPEADAEVHLHSVRMAMQASRRSTKEATANGVSQSPR